MKSYLPSVLVLDRDPNRRIQCKVCVNASGRVKTPFAPQVRIRAQIMFSAMSYEAVSLRVQQSMARAATKLGTMWNTGKGGLHPSLAKYAPNTIVQVASWSC